MLCARVGNLLILESLLDKYSNYGPNLQFLGNLKENGSGRVSFAIVSQLQFSSTDFSLLCPQV